MVKGESLKKDSLKRKWNVETYGILFGFLTVITMLPIFIVLWSFNPSLFYSSWWLIFPILPPAIIGLITIIYDDTYLGISYEKWFYLTFGIALSLMGINFLLRYDLFGLIFLILGLSNLATFFSGIRSRKKRK